VVYVSVRVAQHPRWKEGAYFCLRLILGMCGLVMVWSYG
jgi:hypothetical protein